ncbi:MAG TPA: hypothetical protein VEE84_07455 [Burkholderiaceae bacterium]|nr:hypothetical protein [Burkholderiaceae bacterium]
MSTPIQSPEAPRSVLRELFAGSDASSTSDALELAATRARAHGFVVLQLGVQPPTELRELAKFHAAIALQCVRFGHPMAPTAIVSGGPLLAPDGHASPAEFVLALALALDEHRAIYAYACIADAQSEGSACFGALIGPDSLARARQLHIDLAQRLVAGDAKAACKLLGDYEEMTPSPVAKGVLRAILITQEE